MDNFFDFVKLGFGQGSDDGICVGFSEWDVENDG